MSIILVLQALIFNETCDGTVYFENGHF